tara:strand:+ start:46 stop:525 length:480 start_codon:yes stop_codon:yes gene_type:complete
MLEQIERIAKIIGVIVACFGVAKYVIEINQKKIDKSIGYFDEYRTGDVFQAQKKIAILTYNWTKLVEEGQEDIYEKMETDLVSYPHRLYADILIDFYQSAYICYKSGSCNKARMQQLFEQGAKNNVRTLYPLLKYMRSVDPDYGNGLLCLAGNDTGQHC